MAVSEEVGEAGREGSGLVCAGTSGAEVAGAGVAGAGAEASGAEALGAGDGVFATGGT